MFGVALSLRNGPWISLRGVLSTRRRSRILVVLLSPIRIFQLKDKQSLQGWSIYFFLSPGRLVIWNSWFPQNTEINRSAVVDSDSFVICIEI